MPLKTSFSCQIYNITSFKMMFIYPPSVQGDRRSGLYKLIHEFFDGCPIISLVKKSVLPSSNDLWEVV